MNDDDDFPQDAGSQRPQSPKAAVVDLDAAWNALSAEQQAAKAAESRARMQRLGGDRASAAQLDMVDELQQKI